MTSSLCHDQKIGNTESRAWTKEEDDKLVDYIKAHGTAKVCWSTLPKAAGLQRCGKCCRMRWMNKLRPETKGRDFCADEEELIIRLHALLGNRWSLIAGRLPGRNENEVKEHWNSHIRGKLESLGIDPENHRVSQIALYTENMSSMISSESSSKQDLSKSGSGAFPSSSSPNFTAVKRKRQHESDEELKVDIEGDQDREKHARIIFK